LDQLARIGEEKWEEIERAAEQEKILEKTHTQKALELGNKESFQKKNLYFLSKEVFICEW
jgi:hypothetical protein